MTAYRHALRRTVNPMLENGTLAWIMLNPSTADDTLDDPTIRKCVGFTHRAGYSALVVGNLYPLRATDPRDLWAASEVERIGPDPAATDAALAALCTDAHAIVLAWGAHAARCPERVGIVIGLAVASGRPLYHVGLTKDGHPRHPLMVGYAAGLTLFGATPA